MFSIPDAKNYSAIVLKNALKSLEYSDPSIKKSNYKTKTTILNTLVSKGFPIDQLPSKSGLKSALSDFKKAVKNTKRIASSASSMASSAAMRAKKREEKAQMREQKRQAALQKKAAAAEQKRIKQLQAKLKREGAAKLKEDKKAAAAERRMVSGVQKQLKKEKILNTPEPDILRSTFKGPLLPTQQRAPRVSRRRVI